MIQSIGCIKGAIQGVQCIDSLPKQRRSLTSRGASFEDGFFFGNAPYIFMTLRMEPQVVASTPQSKKLVPQ